MAGSGWKAAIALPTLTRRLISMRQRQIEVLDFLLDDHFALWDFANTFPAHRPDAPSSANYELLELIRAGHVALTFGNWFENQTEPIPVELADRPLQDPANWEPTGKNPGYVLELTEQGRQHLRFFGIGPAD